MPALVAPQLARAPLALRAAKRAPARGAVAAAAGDASCAFSLRGGDDGLVLFAEADVDVNTAGPEAPRDERVGLAPLVAGGVGAVDAHDGVEEAEAAARERGARGRPDAADVDAALLRERRALGEAGGARVQRDAGVAARREGDGQRLAVVAKLRDRELNPGLPRGRRKY